MKSLRNVLGVLLLGSVAMAQNIVQNPGFEAGSFAPWVTKGWDVAIMAPHTGTHFAEAGCAGASCITPDPGNGTWLYQNLATTPGATYTLTFFYFPGPSGAGSAELQVLWGANGTALTTGGAGSCTGNCVFDNTSIGSTTYVQYTVSNLVATSSSMRLEFLARQDPDFDGLDDVVVQLTTPAPGPGTGTAAGAPSLTTWGLVLLAVGLLVLGGRLVTTSGRAA